MYYNTITHLQKNDIIALIIIKMQVWYSMVVLAVKNIHAFKAIHFANLYWSAELKTLYFDDYDLIEDYEDTLIEKKIMCTDKSLL